MDLGLEVDHTREPAVVVAVTGELDSYSAPRVRECILELVNQGCRQVVFDLGGTDFIDTAGLAVLVAGLKRLRANGGELSLVAGSQKVTRLLEMTGLSTVFRTFGTVDQAIGE